VDPKFAEGVGKADHGKHGAWAYNGGLG